MRKLVILTQPEAHDFGSTIRLVQTASQPFELDFSQARSLLGKQLPCALYDMRGKAGLCLNLEALAIVAGCIMQGGSLVLLCPDWQRLEEIIDEDALRWNGQEAIATPRFYAHFKRLVEDFGFELDPPDFALTSGQNPPTFGKFTPQQAHIFEKLPSHPAQVHLITAPRGRGKSTLAGKLAQALAQEQKVLVTAKNQAALASFWQEASANAIDFMAPDHLMRQIEQGQISPNHWLFIDEASSLPLPMLGQLCHFFQKVVLTTTTQNYEGTGKGFSLKFLPLLGNKPYKHWQLTTPLRFKENDPLEAFINQLLLLEEDQVQGQDALHDFYQLLCQAHYKTTPSDLRRLFDAPHQHYLIQMEEKRCLAGLWAVEEGGLDEALTAAIWQGTRRPQGNLVAQYLCFQANLPQACRLRSLRISRIAVEPSKQNQGRGKRLVSDFILQAREKGGLDYLSVSFGLTQPLYHFWLACGFKLVQISQKPEASSGYHSAMMLLPLSPQGKSLVDEALSQFERDLPLLPLSNHLQEILPKPPLVEMALSERDWQNLHLFATTPRKLSACYASLKRLQAAYPKEFTGLDKLFSSQGEDHKALLAECKKAILGLGAVDNSPLSPSGSSPASGGSES
ncbi:hypothetical protein A4G20_07125 [Pasteurellaceae bacterium RH1A]|nr:hypothetical protein A4G20_07125 [Pasteurellaceae bacterium RH1A]